MSPHTLRVRQEASWAWLTTVQDSFLITWPLSELTKKDWLDLGKRASRLIDNSQTKTSKYPCDEILSPWKRNQCETNVIVHASPVSLGAILAQRDTNTNPTYIVVYSSRALTMVEQRYSQTVRKRSSCYHLELWTVFAISLWSRIQHDHRPQSSSVVGDFQQP